MSLIRAIIVDDEPLARRRLKSLLKAHADIQVVAECGDAEHAIQAVSNEHADLLFLDVQMPGRNGFDVLAAIDPSKLPVVVFVTAFDQYAVKAFEIQALDYLLKPFDIERFESTLDRARALIAQERGGDLSRRLLALIRDRDQSPAYLKRIKVKAGGGFQFFRTEEIDWIEAEANYLRIHVGKSSYLVRGTVSSIEDLLNPNQFVRIHRSTIVNVDSIKEMHPWFQNGEYTLSMKDGCQLTISRGYRDRLARLVVDLG